MATGKWTALDAGVGGGVDSYFEYLVKGSIMFSNTELLDMFYGRYIHVYLNGSVSYHFETKKNIVSSSGYILSFEALGLYLHHTHRSCFAVCLDGWLFDSDGTYRG